jgi:hypothetical protein
MPDTFASTFRDMPRSARMVRTRWPKLLEKAGFGVAGLGQFASFGFTC